MKGGEICPEGVFVACREGVLPFPKASPDACTSCTSSPICRANPSRSGQSTPPPLDRSTINSPTLTPSFVTTAANKSMKFLRSSGCSCATNPASMNDNCHSLAPCCWCCWCCCWCCCWKMTLPGCRSAWMKLSSKTIFKIASRPAYTLCVDRIESRWQTYS